MVQDLSGKSKLEPSVDTPKELRLEVKPEEVTKLVQSQAKPGVAEKLLLRVSQRGSLRWNLLVKMLSRSLK